MSGLYRSSPGRNHQMEPPNPVGDSLSPLAVVLFVVMDRFEVECENCGSIQLLRAEEFPVCENCDSYNLRQVTST